MSVVNIGKLQENTTPLCKINSSGKRYQRIWTCLTGEVETPSSPIRRQASDVKYPEKVERRPDIIPDVRYPEKVERWNVGQTEFFPRWNELCRALQGGPSACAKEREPRGIF